jgi:hypothetical protein
VPLDRGEGNVVPDARLDALRWRHPLDEPDDPI